MTSDAPLRRGPLVASGMSPGSELLARGRSLAATVSCGRNLFLDHHRVASEAAYKRAAASQGRIMQHAQIGFRDMTRTVDAMKRIVEECALRDVTVDRFGIALDWSMGYPRDMRATRSKGTGIVMSSPDDFRRITDATVAAAHFGDFMLGLPGALDNTQAALLAGATVIGNLGQYFTFRLPDWDDDVATTEATVTALGLIAAQPVEVLVHSNLDDGFAGLFADMSSALGMVLIEKFIVEDLIGARLSHCYGHHFSRSHVRLSFHRALARLTETPGTMIFGNTVSYKSTPAGNFASLASYLQADIWSLLRDATGHAVNPVPVTENERIPDIDEIIDAQIFAGRLVEHARLSQNLIDYQVIDLAAEKLIAGARIFSNQVLAGLAEIGIDVNDPAALLLALRRIGPRRLEATFAAGARDREAWGGRRAIMQAEWVEELEHDSSAWVESVGPSGRNSIGGTPLKVCIASSDVHEHGKNLIERVLHKLAVEVIDAGHSVDPADLVEAAIATGADIIAISTYNGIALRFAREVRAALHEAKAEIPVCIGGRLNEIPSDSNSGLPLDVSADIAALGVRVCQTPEGLTAFLAELAANKHQGCGSRQSSANLREGTKT